MNLTPNCLACGHPLGVYEHTNGLRCCLRCIYGHTEPDDATVAPPPPVLSGQARDGANLARTVEVLGWTTLAAMVAVAGYCIWIVCR